MFINFDHDLGVEEVTFELKLGNQTIERKKIQAPRQMLEMMFMNYVQQMRGHPSPLYLCMSGNEIIWDNFEQKQKNVTMNPLDPFQFILVYVFNFFNN